MPKLTIPNADYEVTEEDMITFRAHGLAVPLGKDGYRLALRTELRADPGSVGVNNPDPGALIAVVKAALSARQIDYSSAGSPDRDSLRILRQFADMYRSGAQGCQMDFEAAQALALSIDDVLSSFPAAGSGPAA